MESLSRDCKELKPYSSVLHKRWSHTCCYMIVDHDEVLHPNIQFLNILDEKPTFNDPHKSHCDTIYVGFSGYFRFTNAMVEYLLSQRMLLWIWRTFSRMHPVCSRQSFQLFFTVSQVSWPAPEIKAKCLLWRLSAQMVILSIEHLCCMKFSPAGPPLNCGTACIEFREWIPSCDKRRKTTIGWRSSSKWILFLLLLQVLRRQPLKLGQIVMWSIWSDVFLPVSSTPTELAAGPSAPTACHPWRGAKPLTLPSLLLW